MEIYHYSKKNQEYIGSTDARLDPKEAGLGEEKYLIPANATTIVPPVVGIKQAAVFDQAWILVPDYRGDLVYDSETGQPFIITEINVVPGVTKPPPEGLMVPKWDTQLLEWIEAAPREVIEYRVISLRAQVAHASGLSVETRLIQDLRDAEDKLLTL